MDVDAELPIPLSKARLIGVAFGAIVFVALGCLLLVIGSGRSGLGALVMATVGMVGVVFFGLALLFSARKLLDNSAGLIINADGIVDNSSGVALGFIPWGAIDGVTVSSVHAQRFLTVHLRSPEGYLNRGNWLKRVANKANYKYYGSPVQISANALKISFDDLVMILEGRLRQSRTHPLVNGHSQGAAGGA